VVAKDKNTFLVHQKFYLFQKLSECQTLETQVTQKFVTLVLEDALADASIVAKMESATVYRVKNVLLKLQTMVIVLFVANRLQL